MIDKSNHHVLIIDDVHPDFLKLLRNFEVVYKPEITLEDLPEALSDATILVIRSKLNFDKNWIDKSPRLKLIGRLGSGMDNIDIDYAQTKSIDCINAPEGNRNAVAEQTIGMMLSLLSNIVKSNIEISRKLWLRKENEGVELKNLTVGIIGYGNVGKVLAQRLKSFNCEILAYDKYIKDFGDELVEESTLEEVQNRADIISLHVPLNPYSQEMINNSFIEKMSKPFYLLNLSRGKVVSVPAVMDGLSQGKILGLALDVLPNESLGTYSFKEKEELEFLIGHNRVILTPHTGGLTQDSYQMLAHVLAEKLILWTRK